MSVAMSMPSGSSLKQDFDRDGFIAIRPLFDAARMAEINRELDRYLRDVVPKMKDTEVYYEDKSDRSTVKQMMFLERYDPYFDTLLNSSVVHDLAVTVLGEPAIAQNMEYFNKPPGIGKQTPPHQDGYYFKIAPPQAVTGWLALEPVDMENGCLQYVRGSHKGEGWRPHGRSEILGFSQGITDFGTSDDVANTVSNPGSAGMLLMHHCKTVHWASPNRSPTRSRRALGFVFYGESARPDEEAKRAYQAKLDAELKAANKI
jgi:ectoine hydroxylase-related dioxygenase (phytanoyl-CoA dioxygenase family)